MHESFLVYARYRYLRVALAMSVLAVAAYWWHRPPDGPNGGTWLGYGLGGIGAALIGIFLWLGVRKRRYRSNLGTVQGWLSAHVYLGLALPVVVTLHTGFQFGANVHTVAYVMMVLVVLSGMYGVFSYARLPGLLTDNRVGMTRESMLEEIAGLDREALRLADAVDTETHAIVLHAIEQTRIGGGARQQLFPSPGVPTHEQAIERLHDKLARTQDAASADTLRKLGDLMRQKLELVRRLRRDVRYQGLLEAWLYVHVPLSFGLLGALLAHVVSVFWYW